MTIYVTLPNFFQDYKLIEYLTLLSRKHIEYFKEHCVFIQRSGQFPYCCWNGGINNNYGPGAYYNNFEFFTNIVPPLRLNCANIKLEKTDYNNIMANTILNIFHNGSNLIEISNLELMDIISEKYPNYKFVLSKEANLITPFTSDLLNDILTLNKFELIGLPPQLAENIDELKKINKRNKLEITVNPMCPLSCKNYLDCSIKEHERQIMYSGTSHIGSCHKIYPCKIHKKIKTLEDIKNIYVPLGINHITFSSYYINLNDMCIFYMQYFIKPEYYLEFLNGWNQIING